MTLCGTLQCITSGLTRLHAAAPCHFSLWIIYCKRKINETLKSTQLSWRDTNVWDHVGFLKGWLKENYFQASGCYDKKWFSLFICCGYDLISGSLRNCFWNVIMLENMHTHIWRFWKHGLGFPWSVVGKCRAASCSLCGHVERQPCLLPVSKSPPGSILGSSLSCPFCPHNLHF